MAEITKHSSIQVAVVQAGSVMFDPDTWVGKSNGHRYVIGKNYTLSGSTSMKPIKQRKEF